MKEKDQLETQPIVKNDGQFAVPDTQRLNKITGILTSRIETKNKEKQPYYYGFFKLEGKEGEFPVVFKTKPDLKKGSQVLLKGTWAQSNNSRPSFTATQYQIDLPHQVQINCFYSSKFSRCAFTTHESQLMEKHYRQKHYTKTKEVIHG